MGQVKFEEDRCKGCGLCVAACPKQVLVMAGRFNRSGFHPAEPVSDERVRDCTGCAMCGRMCPDMAITVWR